MEYEFAQNIFFTARCGMSDEMAQYPPDLRSRYEKVAEVLRGRGFEFMKDISMGVPGINWRYWDKDEITILVICVGDRAHQFRLLVNGNLKAVYCRISHIFKYLEQHGWEGGEK